MQEDIPQMYTKIDAETTEFWDRTLPDLLAEAIQDAKLATEKLQQHSNEDALKEGLHLLRKRYLRASVEAVDVTHTPQSVGTSPRRNDQPLLAGSLR